MLSLFKLGLAIALGLAVTQQVVNFLDNRARVANRPQMERTYQLPPRTLSAMSR